MPSALKNLFNLSIATAFRKPSLLVLVAEVSTANHYQCELVRYQYFIVCWDSNDPKTGYLLLVLAGGYD